MQNVTDENIFALINERMLAEKATCVISNLSISQLNERYTERVVSRFIDTDAFRVFKLSGANLRYEKGGA
jgi:DNA replication protein DnaC